MAKNKAQAPHDQGERVSVGAEELVATARSLVSLLGLAARAQGLFSAAPEDDVAKILADTPEFRAVIDRCVEVARTAAEKVDEVATLTKIASAVPAIAARATELDPSGRTHVDAKRLREFHDYVTNAVRDVGVEVSPPTLPKKLKTGRGGAAELLIAAAAFSKLTADATLLVEQACAHAEVHVSRAFRSLSALKQSGTRLKDRRERIATLMSRAYGGAHEATSILKITTTLSGRKQTSQPEAERSRTLRTWIPDARGDAVRLAILAALGVRWEPTREEIELAYAAAHKIIFGEWHNFIAAGAKGGDVGRDDGKPGRASKRQPA